MTPESKTMKLKGNVKRVITKSCSILVVLLEIKRRMSKNDLPKEQTVKTRTYTAVFIILYLNKTKIID